MARTPQVTRTIMTTVVLALCLDIAEQKPYEAEFVLPRTFKDNSLALKALEKIANDETHKVVHIKSLTVNETLYCMSEQDFISIAKVLPPRGTKSAE